MAECVAPSGEREAGHQAQDKVKYDDHDECRKRMRSQNLPQREKALESCEVHGIRSEDQAGVLLSAWEAGELRVELT